MTTLSIQDLGLRQGQLTALGRKARRRGKTAQQYIRWLIERDLLADKTFDEILGPIRDDFRKSRVTENELDQIVDRARGASPRKRRGSRR